MSAAATSRWNRKRNLVWLAAYLAVVALIVWAVFEIRRTTMRDMATPEAQAEWQAWRDAPVNHDEGGPVKRRPPSSAEPPALVLLRDYFGVILTGAVLFSSLLFAALMLAARGALAADTPATPVTSKRVSH